VYAVSSTAGFAQPPGFPGAVQCSAKPPLRPAPTSDSHFRPVSG